MERNSLLNRLEKHLLSMPLSNCKITQLCNSLIYIADIPISLVVNTRFVALSLPITNNGLDLRRYLKNEYIIIMRS
jgi:hypothetical protein